MSCVQKRPLVFVVSYVPPQAATVLLRVEAGPEPGVRVSGKEAEQAGTVPLPGQRSTRTTAKQVLGPRCWAGKLPFLGRASWASFL